MDRTGSDDHQQPVVLAVDDLGRGRTGLLDGLVGFYGGGDIVTQERGGDQRVVLRDRKDVQGQDGWSGPSKEPGFGFK